MTTQTARIRKHLEDGKTITPAMAITVYGIFRLAAVIDDLRNSGMEIDTVIKHDEMGKKYAEYRQRTSISLRSKVQVRTGCGIGLPSWVRKHRSATVVGKHTGVSMVRFVRGKNLADIWLNDKELVNAD